ncbi:MAG: hypothetical protein QN162_14455 [Armatimonadota bacterium]|nr:hypothetical protein [Armatimonadota bacterium]
MSIGGYWTEVLQAERKRLTRQNEALVDELRRLRVLIARLQRRLEAAGLEPEPEEKP